MPSPVVPWVQFQPFPAKALNIALYTTDGTTDNTNGIAFASWRPILFEAYNRTLALTTSTGGTRTALASSGATTACWVVYDSAGFFGQSQDLPAYGYYQFKAAVRGSTGDGVNPGGWYLVAHFAPLSPTATQTSVGADLLQNGSFLVAGTRHLPTSASDGTPFCLDLVNCGTNVFAPAVTVSDSASAGCHTVTNATDASGETPRFFAAWAGISASSAGTVTFTPAGTYTWTAPAGVTQVTGQLTGSGGGGGAGNSATLTTGGGGGGGGEDAQRTVGVTPGNNYPVTVGAGGAGGATAGANGANGQATSFSGDTQSFSAHAGHGGTGATTTVSGTGGTGGTGSGAPIHFNGGTGAGGSNNAFGGGGASSAGTAVAGNSAGGSTGAPAPAGGGPGGGGGQQALSVVQTASGNISKSNTLTVTFPKPVTSGNTVICTVIYQGKPATVNGSFSDPHVVLSDGTALQSEITADLTNISTIMQNGLYDVYNVTGGQTGVTVTGFGSTAQGDYRGIAADIMEVSGLGTPTIDQQNQTTAGGSTTTKNYSVTAATADAPELWVSMVGAQQTAHGGGPFDIGKPSAKQGWTLFAQNATQAGSPDEVFSRQVTGYQTATATGTATLSGSFTEAVSYGALIVTYFPQPATPGMAPSTGPGGGGGGGFGQNPGGSGADGQATLTWATASNANYGTPPLPVPATSWPSTTALTANAVNASTGIKDLLNFLANPPLLRAHTTTGQSVPNAAATTLSLGILDVDTYSGWTASTSTWIVPRNGIYLVAGLVPFAASGAGQRLAGVSVNGTVYWGPACNGNAAGPVHAAKTQLMSLNAGDLVQLAAYQSSGGALLTTTDATRLLCVWLGAPGSPAGLPPPPDVGFRWQSGTPGASLPPLMNTHLAGDLGFLVQRPYLLAYQSAGQAGLTQNVFSNVSLDQVKGIVHGDPADNYSGWASGAYTAQVPGVYLVAGEYFATSSSSAGASVIAGIACSTSGGSAPHTTPDWYQHMTTTSAAALGGGGTVLGLYALQAGETLTPQIQGQSYGATYGTLAGSAAGGTLASHLGIIWMGLAQ